MSGLTIQDLPVTSWTEDVLKNPFSEIISLFTHEELVDRVSLVCKKWKAWADEWSKQNPAFWSAHALGQLNVRIFSRYAIEEELKRAMPRTMFAQLSFDKISHVIDFRKALIEASRFYAGIKAAETAVVEDEGLFIVPRPEGLTLRMLCEAYPTRFNYIVNTILEEIGGKESEWGQYIITSNILEKTRGRTVEEQQTLIKQTGSELPEVLNAVFYVLMVEKLTENIGFYTRSGLNPFDTENPFSRGQCAYDIRPFKAETCTQCLQKINSWPLVFGRGFAPEGRLSILSSKMGKADYPDYVDDPRRVSYYRLGASAARKFSGPLTIVQHVKRLVSSLF